MNKTQLAKAVRDVAADLSLSGTAEQDRIAQAFDYLADLIEAIEEDAPKPECETPAEALTYKRWGGTRDIYRVFMGEQVVGTIEKLEHGRRWKALGQGEYIDAFTTRDQAGRRVLQGWRDRNRP